MAVVERAGHGPVWLQLCARESAVSGARSVGLVPPQLVSTHDKNDVLPYDCGSPIVVSV